MRMSLKNFNSNTFRHFGPFNSDKWNGKTQYPSHESRGQTEQHLCGITTLTTW